MIHHQHAIDGRALLHGEMIEACTLSD